MSLQEPRLSAILTLQEHFVCFFSHKGILVFLFHNCLAFETHGFRAWSWGSFSRRIGILAFPPKGKPGLCIEEVTWLVCRWGLRFMNHAGYQGPTRRGRAYHFPTPPITIQGDLFLGHRRGHLADLHVLLDLLFSLQILLVTTEEWQNT